MCVCVNIYTYVYMCVCVSVCVYMYISLSLSLLSLSLSLLSLSLSMHKCIYTYPMDLYEMYMCMRVYGYACVFSFMTWYTHEKNCNQNGAWAWKILKCALKLRVCIGLRGGGLGSRPIFKKVNEPYAPS